ncbi:MAG: M20/M25/M40 family metallo-hydrolase [Proteobacteria bacterium]|nr:M20/M25/M40 family metallo-hydrolase [Pseudomonadota bacterium]
MRIFTTTRERLIRAGSLMLLALAAALFCLPSAARAEDQQQPAVFSAKQLSQAAELRDLALSSADAFRHVASLTMEVGPRLPGTTGDKAAVAWALATMRELGLQNVRAEDVMVPHWERGEIEVGITMPYPQTLAATALGGSIGTPAGGIEAPVIRVTDLDELAATPAAEVAGRIVFFDRRMQASRDGADYSLTVKARKDGPAKAAAKGAIAVIIRSVGTSSNRLPHTGKTTYDDAIRRIPAAAISNPDADMLATQLARGEAVTVKMTISARYLADERSANVIGEIRGAGRPDEIVLLAAHLDSWDLGTGAIDDAAGVGIVLETAAQIIRSGKKPARTIRVLLAADEESGQSGGKAYAEKYLADLHKHVVGMEADFGDGKVWRISTLFPEDRLEIASAIHALLEPLGIEMGDNETGNGADLSEFKKLGMPVISLGQDGTDYFDYHHTANDTLDKVDPDNLRQVVAAFVTTTWLAASGDVDFGFREPEEETKP